MLGIWQQSRQQKPCRRCDQGYRVVGDVNQQWRKLFWASDLVSIWLLLFRMCRGPVRVVEVGPGDR